MQKEIKQLLKTLECGVSPFHVVQESKRQLKEEGFEELSLQKAWKLEKGKGYFLTPYQSSLIAFWIGKDYKNEDMLRIEAAHTDWPCLKIKSLPEKQGKYQTLNVEVYGGPILNTWLDRPLSAAGRVSIKSENIFKPEIKLIDFKKPIFVIPNLAIHMNRDVNKGVEINKQVDLLPLAGMMPEKKKEAEWFLELLAEELKVKKQDILDFEINLYNLDKPELIGIKEEFISSPRLDNITSVQACVYAVTEGKRKDGINVIALFDNEEVGSKTKQGGDSQLLPMILERLYLALGQTREEYLAAAANGMMLSVDVAHAIHPNHPERCDITNQIYLNDGVALKLSGNQRYATDCEAIGIVEQLCQNHGISYKKFANHSNIPGGSTLGSLTSSILPMKTVDMGIPMLAMHSSRETMGKEDQVSICKLMKAFFEEKEK